MLPSEELKLRKIIPGIEIRMVCVRDKRNCFKLVAGHTFYAEGDGLDRGRAEFVARVRLSNRLLEPQKDVLAREHGGIARVERYVVVRVAEEDGLDVIGIARAECRRHHPGGLCDIWRRQGPLKETKLLPAVLRLPSVEFVPNLLVYAEREIIVPF